MKDWLHRWAYGHRPVWVTPADWPQADGVRLTTCARCVEEEIVIRIANPPWLVRDGGEMTRVTIERIADLAGLRPWEVLAAFRSHGVPVPVNHVVVVPKAWIDSIVEEDAKVGTHDS